MIKNFNVEDFSQISIGAFALAVPVSFSEEAWRIGETLPFANLLLVILLSITFLAMYAYHSVFQASIKYRVSAFILRIGLAYIITGVIVALILIAINKFPLLSDPLLALRRLLVIMMPASIGAIVVDGFDKE